MTKRFCPPRAHLPNAHSSRCPGIGSGTQRSLLLARSARHDQVPGTRRQPPFLPCLPCFCLVAVVLGRSRQSIRRLRSLLLPCLCSPSFWKSMLHLNLFFRFSYFVSAVLGVRSFFEASFSSKNNREEGPRGCHEKTQSQSRQPKRRHEVFFVLVSLYGGGSGKEFFSPPWADQLPPTLANALAFLMVFPKGKAARACQNTK